MSHAAKHWMLLSSSLPTSQDAQSIGSEWNTNPEQGGEKREGSQCMASTPGPNTS
jgi:hypothetical protein